MHHGLRWALARTLICATIAAVVPGAFGQSDLTSASGVVRDQSTATVPDAVVTLRNLATGMERKVTTNMDGAYTIPNVPAGAYTIIVEAPGFKRYEQSGNVVAANVTATLDATLTVGAATETVQVTAEAPPIQSDSATLGRNVTTVQIQNLQLNGRNPMLLSLLKPGVNSGTALGGFSFTLSNSININGARNQEVLITQDGAVAVRTRSNGTSIGVADADSTQEVQILTANYNAEYGRASGGQIRVVTKSGTRDLHGSLYEYFRNSALDANSWSRNKSAGPSLNGRPAPFRFNQYGFNVGGPIFIPKVWNRNRSKLFFMFGQEYIRYRQEVQNNLTTTSLVPSLAMRSGDFGELLGDNIFYNSPKIITNPSTGAPFPDNVIPESQLSRNGLALLNMFPLPAGAGSPNYQVSAASPQNQRKDTGAVDYYPKENHYLRFRVLNFEYNQHIPFASNYLVVLQTFERPNQTASLGYVWNLSPTFINEALITGSVDRVRIGIDASNGLWDRTRYGLNYPYLFPAGKQIQNKIPSVALGGPFNELSGLPYPSSSAGPVYVVSDNLTKVSGGHTLKAGFSWERAGENDYDQINIQGVPGGTNNQNGRFAFADTTPGGSGLSIANAALGLFDVYAELGNRSYTPYRGNMWEWFAQDSWKATSRLHIDIGLRQSIIQPYYSLWRNMSVFDPRFYDPAKAVAVDPATGRPVPNTGDPYNGLVIPGNGWTGAAAGRIPAATTREFDYLFRGGAAPKYFAGIHPWQGLQPRFGVAYAINDKTVLRGGIGRFLTRLGVSDSVFLGGNPPFQPSASVSYGSVDDPGGGAANTFPLPVTTEDPVFRNPEAWTWNAALQRDIGFQTSIEVAYVGRRGLHGQQERNINQLLPGTTFANPGVNPDALRPYKGYSAIRSTDNDANSIYHGLQIDVNRRFSKGLLFGVAYTYSKAMDYGSHQRDVLPNAYDGSMQYGFADFDHRHVAVFNVVYELPFRKTGTLAGKLFGGWQVTQVAQFQSGSPVSVQTNDDFAGVGPGSGNSGNANNGFGSRWIVNGMIGQPARFSNVMANGAFDSNQWYAFQTGTNILQPDQGTFTNQRSRNIFFQPGFQNWNFGLFKNFHATEQQFATFRFEAFNWLNHPNRGGATGGGLNVNPKDANFGKVTFKDSQRQLQLSLRYTF